MILDAWGWCTGTTQRDGMGRVEEFILNKKKEKKTKKNPKNPQHSKNNDHGICSHHLMANRWGNNGNSDRLYFLGFTIIADGD